MKRLKLFASCACLALAASSVSATPAPFAPYRTGDWKALEKLVAEWRPAALVVGMPLNDDGSEQAITTLTRKFIRQLEERAKLPVHVSDERFSSRAADVHFDIRYAQ